MSTFHDPDKIVNQRLRYPPPPEFLIPYLPARHPLLLPSPMLLQVYAIRTTLLLLLARRPPHANPRLQP